jgi:hypothetical protein
MTIFRGQEVSELQAIRAVVDAHYQALHDGDLSALQALFLKGAAISGHYEDDCLVQDLAQHLAFLKRLPTPALLGEELELTVSALDTVGNIAQVRTHYLFEALQFTDFLALMKIEGEWRIVSKLFRHE